MYDLKFIKSDGSTIYLDHSHHVIVDLDPLSEVDVNIATSQGFQQVGVSVENRSVGGVYRQLTGKIYGDANEVKEQMLRIFSPSASGKLYFNNRYYCDCVVSKTPKIGVLKRDVVFNIVLFCAYPYWIAVEESTPVIGSYEAAFQFPVCYDTHEYGIKIDNVYGTITNNGMVDAPIDITFSTPLEATNYGVINMETLEELIIEDTLHSGESLHVYRDGVTLHVEKTDTDGVTTDAFSMLSDDSNLFYLYVGENTLRPVSDGDVEVDLSIKFNTIYTGVYDGM